MRPKTVIILILTILSLIVLLQYPQVVTLQFSFWKIGMSRTPLILLLILMGFVIGYLVTKVRRKPPSVVSNK